MLIFELGSGGGGGGGGGWWNSLSYFTQLSQESSRVGAGPLTNRPTVRPCSAPEDEFV